MFASAKSGGEDLWDGPSGPDPSREEWLGLAGKLGSKMQLEKIWLELDDCGLPFGRIWFPQYFEFGRERQEEGGKEEKETASLSKPTRFTTCTLPYLPPVVLATS